MKKESYLRNTKFGMGFVLLMVTAVMLQIPGTAGGQENERGPILYNNQPEIPTVSHMGFVVDDIEQGLDFYERAFGVPCELTEYRLVGTIREKGKLVVDTRDRPGGPPGLIGLMNLWSCPMALQGGHEGPNGEKLLGLQHIAFMVNDVDPWVARLQDKGVELLAAVDRVDPIKGRVRTRTMDTDTMVGGLVIEFIEWENIPLGNKEYYVKIDRDYVRDHNLDIPILSHVGCLVKDVKQTAAFYERVFGVAPCKIFDHNVDNVWVKGEQTKVSIRVASMELWSVPVALIQPISQGHLTEVLKKRGEGFYSLGFLVNNLDTWVDRSREMGVEVLARVDRDDPIKGHVRTATMEPDKMGGLVVEFLEWEKLP